MANFGLLYICFRKNPHQLQNSKKIQKFKVHKIEIPKVKIGFPMLIHKVWKICNEIKVMGKLYRYNKYDISLNLTVIQLTQEITILKV